MLQNYNHNSIRLASLYGKQDWYNSFYPERCRCFYFTGVQVISIFSWVLQV